MSEQSKTYFLVISEIRNRILDGTLKVGDRLPPERQFAAQLNMSRNSIREVIRTLDNMGIVDSVQGSGNYLAANVTRNMELSLSMLLMMKISDMKEITQMRRCIELEAYAEAVSRITKEQLEEMQELSVSMRNSQIAVSNEKDARFHNILVEASGNQVMISMFHALHEICIHSIRYTLEHVSEEEREEIFQVHEKIYQGLVLKNVVLGREALKRHYQIVDSIFCSV